MANNTAKKSTKTRGNTILVTDTLFIAAKHERLLRSSGFEIERLDNPKASEEELCKAIKGKVGYILGGVETVTRKVISAADKLKAISFTGAGYAEFIPAHKEATKKGILISNAPGGNADAVAEHTLALMLMMTRDLIGLGRIGKSSFGTTSSLKDKTVGIVGLGMIGGLVANYLRAIGVRDILYYSRHRKFHLESGLGLKFVSKDDLMSRSNIVTVHVSKDGGDHFLTGADLKMMPKGALLINTAFPEAVDLKALLRLLKEEKVRAAFDRSPGLEFAKLAPNVCYYSNAQTAFNTTAAIETVSDMATRSMINLLTKQNDAFCVNK